MALDLPPGVVVLDRADEGPPSVGRVLSREALAFVAELERRFRPRRAELLARRHARQRDLDAGAIPGFLVETRSVREGDWQVAPTPPALERRRVEITGPVDRKMMINALNSGADCFMADFEDALSPTWANVIEGQANVYDFVRGELTLTAPDGRAYEVGADPATLILRPRGWHLDEAHVLVDDAPVSASLFDFGLACLHNAAEQLARGAGPYFYLPKLESHLEARLWNDVFTVAQELAGVPHGSVRATVLIETVLAAFEMDEILYELRDHAAGLNAGRWDYIFSIVKKFSGRADMVLPDRAQITMTVPFMRAYTELLVRTCHRRGAHAMGGMAAFVPNRRDAAVTDAAIAKVREDKLREAGDGFDGTWVAHPDLVPVAMDVFRVGLGVLANQKTRQRDDVQADTNALLRLDVPDGRVTAAGIRANVDVALQYIDAWLRGSGAVAIHNLMEDAATAEIARAQLWQWLRHRVTTEEGEAFTTPRYAAIRDTVLAALERDRGDAPSRLRDAARLLDDLVLAERFPEFLTLVAYPMLDPVAAADGDAGGVMTDGVPATGAATADTAAAAAVIQRPYGAADVARLRGSIVVEHSLATVGAVRLRELLADVGGAHLVGSVGTPGAVAHARARFDALHATGGAALVRQLSAALLYADRVESNGRASHDPPHSGNPPIVCGVDTPLGDPLHAFDLAIGVIEAGAAGVSIADRVAARQTGLADRDVLAPTGQVIRAIVGARLAADVLGVPAVVIARTVASSAALLFTDVDERDRPFVAGERTADGYHPSLAATDHAIARALAYAPYADAVGLDAAALDVGEARRFAAAVHARFPGKPLAYAWPALSDRHGTLDDGALADARRELGAMGYRLLVAPESGSVGAGAIDGRAAAAYRELVRAIVAGEVPNVDATVGAPDGPQGRTTRLA